MSYSPGSLLLFPMIGLRCQGRWAARSGGCPMYNGRVCRTLHFVRPSLQHGLLRPWKTGADFVKIWVKNRHCSFHLMVYIWVQWAFNGLIMV